MLSRALLGIVKKYRTLATPEAKTKFVKRLTTLLKATFMYEEVDDSELVELVNETHLKELVNQALGRNEDG